MRLRHKYECDFKFTHRVVKAGHVGYQKDSILNCSTVDLSLFVITLMPFNISPEKLLKRVIISSMGNKRYN